MLKSQKLAIRQSELVDLINELQGVETLTDEQRAELDACRVEHRDVGAKYRAAVEVEAAEAEKAAAEETGEVMDAEERERLELRGRVRLNRYLGAALNGREIGGAESEFAAAEECPGMIPMALLDATPEERKAAEERAVTPAPGTVGVTLHPTLPGVFLPQAATALRVEMPRVGAGTQSFPVVSTDVTAAPRDKGQAGPETAGAITVTDVAFKRITGSFRLAIEDLQKLPSLEQTFRANLASVMSDAADSLIVNGVATDSTKVTAVSGFFANTPLVTAATAETTKNTFQTLVAKVLGKLDGNYARSFSDLSLLCAPEVAVFAADLWRGNNSTMNAIQFLNQMTMGVTVTDRLAEASNVSPGMVVRHSVPGRVAVAPTWSGFQVITDNLSAASKGEVVITAVLMQAGAKVLRSSVYEAVSFKTA